MQKVINTLIILFLSVSCTAEGSLDSTENSETESTSGMDDIASSFSTKLLGSSGNDMPNGIVTDSSGNVYITGYTRGDLDGEQNSGYRDAFVTKFNSDLVRQWTKLLGTSAEDVANGIVTDSSGNVYVTGYTSGDLVPLGHSGDNDMFVAKYTSSGYNSWTKQLGSSKHDTSNGIAISSSGLVFIIGVSYGSLPTGVNPQPGVQETFFIMYNSSGELQVINQLETMGGDAGYGITYDSNNELNYTGMIDGKFDGQPNAGGIDVSIVKYDDNAQNEWARQLGTNGYDEGRAIATDSLDNIYVTGITDGVFDGETNTGSDDIFIAKYNVVGIKQWVKQLGTIGYDEGRAIAIDSLDNIYVTGYMHSLGGVVIKYNSSGSKLWSNEIGENVTGIAIDSSDQIYVTGYTSGDLDGQTNAGGFDTFVAKYNSDGVKQ